MADLHVDTHDHVDSGDRSAAAGINLITVLIVLAVLAVLAWFLFTGPLRSMTGPGPNVNQNPPAQQQPNVNINPNKPLFNLFGQVKFIF